MSGSTITTLTAALDGCAAVDLAALSGPQLGAMLIDLRATATRLEVEIARVVHAASRAEVWRAAGATSMEVWLAGAAYADETGRPHHTRIADALTALATAYNAGEISGGRERPKLLVTVPFETITERAAARGVIIGSGTTISGDTARRLACDAELHRVITKGTSVTLDFGTSTRLATDTQYLAMALRDGGCRWPGCDRPPRDTSPDHSNQHPNPHVDQSASAATQGRIRWVARW